VKAGELRELGHLSTSLESSEPSLLKFHGACLDHRRLESRGTNKRKLSEGKGFATVFLGLWQSHNLLPAPLENFDNESTLWRKWRLLNRCRTSGTLIDVPVVEVYPADNQEWPRRYLWHRQWPRNEWAVDLDISRIDDFSQPMLECDLVAIPRPGYERDLEWNEPDEGHVTLRFTFVIEQDSFAEEEAEELAPDKAVALMSGPIWNLSHSGMQRLHVFLRHVVLQLRPTFLLLYIFHEDFQAVKDTVVRMDTKETRVHIFSWHIGDDSVMHGQWTAQQHAIRQIAHLVEWFSMLDADELLLIFQSDESDMNLSSLLSNVDSETVLWQSVAQMAPNDTEAVMCSTALMDRRIAQWKFLPQSSPVPPQVRPLSPVSVDAAICGGAEFELLDFKDNALCVNSDPGCGGEIDEVSACTDETRANSLVLTVDSAEELASDVGSDWVVTLKSDSRYLCMKQDGWFGNALVGLCSHARHKFVLRVLSHDYVALQSYHNGNSWCSLHSNDRLRCAAFFSGTFARIGWDEWFKLRSRRREPDRSLNAECSRRVQAASLRTPLVDIFQGSNSRNCGFQRLVVHGFSRVFSCAVALMTSLRRIAGVVAKKASHFAGVYSHWLTDGNGCSHDNPPKGAVQTLNLFGYANHYGTFDRRSAAWLRRCPLVHSSEQRDGEMLDVRCFDDFYSDMADYWRRFRLPYVLLNEAVALAVALRLQGTNFMHAFPLFDDTGTSVVMAHVRRGSRGDTQAPERVCSCNLFSSDPVMATTDPI
ncbi:MAG: hypothetical protein MHM6MM_008517, partial [Cercozoa sp. M6MM]